MYGTGQSAFLLHRTRGKSRPHTAYNAGQQLRLQVLTSQQPVITATSTEGNRHYLYGGVADSAEGRRGKAHCQASGRHATGSSWNLIWRHVAMSTNRLPWTGRIVFLLLLSAFAVPAIAQTPTDPVTIDRDDGFDDWGLLGLLGLAGLLGRRRSRDMVETRRV